MSSKKIILLPAVIIAFVLLSIYVSAGENFDSSFNPNIYSCKCEERLEKVKITNTGTVASYYGISIVEGADIAISAPREFTLNPGEEKIIYTFIKSPCDKTGNFQIRTRVSTINGLVKDLIQDIEINSCSVTEIDPKVQFQSVCKSDDATFKVILKNTGNSPDMYSIKVDNLNKYSTFNEDVFYVGPKQTYPIYIYVNTDNLDYGFYDLTLIANPVYKDYNAKIPLKLSVNKCITRIIKTPDNSQIKKNYDTQIKNTSTDIKVSREYKPTSVQTIQNKTIKSTIQKQSQPIINKSAKLVIAKSSAKDSLKITNKDLIILLASVFGVCLLLVVSLFSIYYLLLPKKKKVIKTESEISYSVANENFNKSYGQKFEIHSFKKESPKKEFSKKVSKETIISTDALKIFRFVIYTIVLLFVVGLLIYSLLFLNNTYGKELIKWFNYIYNFIKVYAWYVVSGFIVLVVLTLILFIKWWNNRRGFSKTKRIIEKAKKIVKEQESKEKRKKRSMFGKEFINNFSKIADNIPDLTNKIMDNWRKYLVVLILLLLLLGAGFGAYLYYNSITKNKQQIEFNGKALNDNISQTPNDINNDSKTTFKPTNQEKNITNNKEDISDSFETLTDSDKKRLCTPYIISNVSSTTKNPSVKLPICNVISEKEVIIAFDTLSADRKELVCRSFLANAPGTIDLTKINITIEYQKSVSEVTAYAAMRNTTQQVRDKVCSIYYKGTNSTVPIFASRNITFQKPFTTPSVNLSTTTNRILPVKKIVLPRKIIIANITSQIKPIEISQPIVNKINITQKIPQKNVSLSKSIPAIKKTVNIKKPILTKNKIQSNITTITFQPTNLTNKTQIIEEQIKDMTKNNTNETIIIEEVKESKKIGDYFNEFKYYIFSAIITIIALIMMLFIINSYKKERKVFDELFEDEKEFHEEKKTEKKLKFEKDSSKKNIWLIYLILGLIIISIGIFGFYYVKYIPKGDIETSNYSTTEIISNNSIDNNQINKLDLEIKNTIEKINSENKTDSFYYQIWEENTVKTIDLNNIFFDPDRDSLIFSSNYPEHFSVDITEGIALLTPEKNWYGIELIEFSAEDSNGGIARSGNIQLIITKGEKTNFMYTVKSKFNQSWNYFISLPVIKYIDAYKWYILAGIMILIFLILIINYYRKIINLFNKKEDIFDKDLKVKKKNKKRK